MSTKRGEVKSRASVRRTTTQERDQASALLSAGDRLIRLDAGQKRQAAVPHPAQRSGHFLLARIWSKYALDDQQAEGNAIIVGPASDEIASIHDRQQLIVLPEDYDEWLDRENDGLDRLAEMLRH